jgi:hypothetical protein
LSTLPRISLPFLPFLILILAACSPEQSRDIGAQPKKTMDRATGDVNKAMQQGSDRLKKGE